MSPTIRPSQKWSWGPAFSVGLVTGSAAFVESCTAVFLTVDVVAGWLAIAAFICVALGLPAMVGYASYRRMATLQTYLIFGIGIGVGFFALPVADTLLAHRDMLQAQTALYVAIGLAPGPTFAAFVWLLCRLVRGRVIVEQDFACPKCDYSLRGNTTGICPECGHAYTLRELGIKETS
jgi:hypothetical protein